jgi:membrane-anchored mycosin MYCP
MSRIAVAALVAMAAPALGLAVAAGDPATAFAAVAPGAQPLGAAAPAATASPTAGASSSPTPGPSPTPTAPLTLPAGMPEPPAPVPVTSASQPNCQSAPQQPYSPTSSSISTTPWAQNVLNFTSAWPLTMGSGVTVAVIDSGIDYSSQLADSAQLGDRVSAIDLTNTETEDCVGHGTAVAGIIAAADEQPEGYPFAGVAPDAKILSIKVTNSAELTGDPGVESDAIIDAVRLGAGVINVSIQSNFNSPQMAYAVNYALSHNVVVVAAAGNDEPNPDDPAQILRGPFWPASYPGVLSVGAVEPDGSLATSFADPFTRVDVTAPGVGVTSTASGGYVDNINGTSFAAPFVAGVAALIRARYPTMTAAQVVARIDATADGNTGPGTGNGLVNPLQAVTAALPLSTSLNTSLSPGSGPVSVSRPASLSAGTRDAAMAVTGGSLGAAALVAVGALVISQGRRRRWRAGTAKAQAAKTPADDVVPEDPFW